MSFALRRTLGSHTGVPRLIAAQPTLHCKTQHLCLNDHGVCAAYGPLHFPVPARGTLPNERQYRLACIVRPSES